MLENKFTYIPPLVKIYMKLLPVNNSLVIDLSSFLFLRISKSCFLHNPLKTLGVVCKHVNLLGGAAPQTATFSRFLAANILSEIDIKKGN